MKILITSVNLRYENDVIDSVDVRFVSNNPSINLSGGFNLSAQEYQGNESTAQLEAIAKQRISEVTV